MNGQLGWVPILQEGPKRAIWKVAKGNFSHLSGAENLPSLRKEFFKIRAGARSSPLSKAQVEEVIQELLKVHPEVILDPVWAETPGDRDRTASLKTMEKTDFFTRDLDEMLLGSQIRIAIHSAKDLPDPLPQGLILLALTRGVDSRDSLVLRPGDRLETLPERAKIAASSERREQMVRDLRRGLICKEIRGTIGERLEILNRKEVDGVIMAEAALIRLKLDHLNRIVLPWKTTPLQGKLAIVGREEDREMAALFSTFSI